jgi:hypothetical protein
VQKLIYGGKLIVAMAGSWAIGASLFIFFSPVTARGVTSRSFRDSSIVVETFTKQQSWYEAQGLWGVFVLVIFSGLYLLAVRLAWRSNYVALAFVSVIAVALSIITGFSVGGVYLPAALGLFVATLMFLSSKLLGS